MPWATQITESETLKAALQQLILIALIMSWREAAQASWVSVGNEWDYCQVWTIVTWSFAQGGSKKKKAIWTSTFYVILCLLHPYEADYNKM